MKHLSMDARLDQFLKHAENLSQWNESQEKQLSLIQANIDKIQTALAQRECANHSPYELSAIEDQLLRQIHDHRAELTRITQHAMTRISRKATLAAAELDENKLKLQHLLHQSIDKIDENETEKHFVMKEKSFEWSTLLLTIFSSLLTALVFGLYANSEYPWETHAKATHERGAGKLLIQAWPFLTSGEKDKILHSIPKP